MTYYGIVIHIFKGFWIKFVEMPKRQKGLSQFSFWLHAFQTGFPSHQPAARRPAPGPLCCYRGASGPVPGGCMAGGAWVLGEGGSRNRLSTL